MTQSRRDLALLLPALMAATASGQQATLPSKTWRFEDLLVKENGKNRSRAVLNGKTLKNFPIEMHETELAAGDAPHPPHHHEHVELMMIREGSLEVTIAGKVSVLTPGSVAFVAPNEEHGWRNVGGTTAHYFVMTLGRES